MHRFLRRTLCALLVLAVVPAANAGTCYVTTTGSNVNSGTSWASPYDLQTALGTTTCTEIWVKAGVYKPAASDRTVSFSVNAGVAVYGGFAGTESTRGQRNPAANSTVLSGDLAGNDTGAANGIDATVPTDSSNAENSYNVVVMNGRTAAIGASTILDGFTLTGGNANNNAAAQTQDGGALFCNGEQGGTCSPTLSNLVFSGNTATYGGALYADGTSGTSSPTFIADTFSGNMATGYGGAVYLLGYSGTNASKFTNVTFSGNSTPGSGGAITSASSNPTLLNVTFSANSGRNYGGALYQAGGGGATLTNVILVDDSGYGNTEIWADGNAGITLDHSLIWDSGSGSCPPPNPAGFGGYYFCGSGMVYLDPKLGPLQNNGGYTPTLLPAAGSAAIDTGNDSNCPSTDQRGVARPQGLHCDIGAVEVQRTLPCYVAATATGANNGFDWADAFTSLQAALATTGCSEIWVAKGVYKPTTGTDQTISFSIPSGTAVYGGFGGNETLRSASDPRANPTVLSGDLLGNDTGAANGIDASVPTDGTNSDNSYHVVYFDGRTTSVTATTVLDGFVVTAGNANGSFPDDSGGGLICNANHAGTGVCNPTLSRLVFSGNFASGSTGGGGALYDDGYNGIASPTLTDVVFSGNESGNAGGAMRNDSYGSGSASSPALRNVTFSGNTAGNPTNAIGEGGAMYNASNAGAVSNPVLTNVTFSGNISGNSGGAIANSGNSNPTLTNVTFSNNSAQYYGGAISNDSPAHPTLTNAILWADTITGGGGASEIFNNTSATTLDHSIVQGGCPPGSTCTNLVTGDPKLGALAYNGGFTPTFLPSPGSAAIETGKDIGCPATDQRGIARPQGAHCDIGAVEVVAYDRIFADNFDGTPTP